MTPVRQTEAQLLLQGIPVEATGRYRVVLIDPESNPVRSCVVDPEGEAFCFGKPEDCEHITLALNKLDFGDCSCGSSCTCNSTDGE